VFVKPTLRLRLLGAGLVVLGGVGWIALAATTDEPWSEAFVIAGIWIAVALLGWQAPLIAALLLFLGAVFGALGALLLTLAHGLEQIDVTNAHDNSGEFWGYLGWWTVLPLVAALLFVADARRGVAEEESSPTGSSH